MAVANPYLFKRLVSRVSSVLSVLSAAALALVLAGACAPRPYTSLSETAEPLRTQFNQDVGRTRIVMLVAPT
jgi:hypothetical protein